ncbi:phage antirepressor KilAC domain-containing protein, partial [uncultured Ruminococcus sp.]|uniref:phage antirepressor KilAC domain-containing protein n=1 Tax=uncultured Ruminococcus sp. TaxID=165186 RepID=UPI000A87C713
FGSLRTLTDEHGRTMFCGKDVASALGYSNTKDAIRRHCRWGVKHDLPHPQSPARTIEMVFIPEGDVYRLISHSRLPSAEKFESWIFDEVLPTIRRTGGYVASEDMFIENYLPFLDEPYRDLFRLQMTAIEKLNERIRNDKPLVDFALHVADSEDLIDMNAMAKLAADKNFNIGRTRLFRWLKEMGVLMSNNLPYQRYIDRGYFAVKESVFEVEGMKKTYRQTFVTGNGQLFIIGLLRKYYGKEMS